MQRYDFGLLETRLDDASGAHHVLRVPFPWFPPEAKHLAQHAKLPSLNLRQNVLGKMPRGRSVSDASSRATRPGPKLRCSSPWTPGYVSIAPELPLAFSDAVVYGRARVPLPAEQHPQSRHRVNDFEGVRRCHHHSRRITNAGRRGPAEHAL